MKGLNGPFPHIKVLLARLEINNLVRLALSDAPKHLGYLRLKEAKLTHHLDKLIARQSPSDSKFHPDFHMENKPFLIPVLESHVAKPNTDLETVLGIPFDQIADRYFMIGNSGYSDVGLAQRTGMLCYHSHWDDGTDEDRKILLAYAPESALKHNVGTAASTNVQIDPRFEKIDVWSPLEILADLEKRGIIKPPSGRRRR
jgi:hypothetical protein